jgi:hypothetical protein
MPRKPVDYIDLPPDVWRELIASCEASIKAKAEHDSASRKLEESINNFKDRVREAIGNKLYARCGNATITIKQDADVPGKITQKDGTPIPLADVTAFLVGRHNDPVPMSHIKSIFAGRAGSWKLKIEGKV